jgi:hypothetical protein
LILNILESFGGYTLTTLLAEDAELLQLLAIREVASPKEGEEVPDEQ